MILEISARFLKHNQMLNVTKLLLVGAEFFYANGRTGKET